MKANKIAFAIGALVAGSAAMATPILPSSGPSDLFVVVWNSNAAGDDSAGFGNTVVQAIEETPAQMQSLLAGGPLTFGLDTSASQLDADLGTSNAADINYAVVAGTQTTNSTFQYSSVSTLAQLNSGSGGVITKTQVNGAMAAVGAWLGNIYGPSDLVVLAGSSNNAWTGPNGPGLSTGVSLNGFNVDPNVGTSMEFFQSVAENNGQNGCASKAGCAGNSDMGFNSSVNFTNGSITFASSAVPLPAAVWLLASGLLGLGGLSRRRSVTNG